MNTSAPLDSQKTYFAALCGEGLAVQRVANVSDEFSGAKATDKTATNEEPMGILVAAVAAGAFGEVVCFGKAKAKAGAAITPGTDTLLTTDANGRLIPAAAGETCWAIFRGRDTAAADDWIDVFVFPGNA